MAQTASAAVLLTDNFTVLPGGVNNQDVNQNLAGGRQGGLFAGTTYTMSSNDHHQVGNTATDVGQPVVSDGNYVLLAFNGWFQSNLVINEALVGGLPLNVSFNMYGVGAAANVSRNNGDPTVWNAFTLRSVGTDAFPVAGTDEFGMLQRWNGGLQVFTDGGSVTPGGWDTTNFANSPQWSFIFSDTAGTGSAFSGSGGSKVQFINGGVSLGTVNLGQLSTAGLVFGWRDLLDNGHHQFGGIDDLSISTVPEPAGAVLLPASFGLLALRRRRA